MSPSDNIAALKPQVGTVFVEEHPFLECFDIMVEWADGRVERVSGVSYTRREAMDMAMHYALAGGLPIEHPIVSETEEGRRELEASEGRLSPRSACGP
jgi:hypothetical protein